MKSRELRRGASSGRYPRGEGGHLRALAYAHDYQREAVADGRARLLILMVLLVLYHVMDLAGAFANTRV